MIRIQAYENVVDINPSILRFISEAKSLLKRDL